MEKENQRVALSKRLLKEALLRLLEEKELDKITISELCKEASINRATFYRHYETPRDVLLDIEQEYSRKLRKVLPTPQTMEDMRHITEGICVFLYEHADLLKILLRCLTGEEIAKAISNNIHKLSESLTDTLPMDDDAQQLVSTYFGYGTYHLLRQWIMEDIQKTPQEIAELISAITDIRKKS